MPTSDRPVGGTQLFPHTCCVASVARSKRHCNHLRSPVSDGRALDVSSSVDVIIWRGVAKRLLVGVSTAFNVGGLNLSLFLGGGWFNLSDLGLPTRRTLSHVA